MGSTAKIQLIGFAIRGAICAPTRSCTAGTDLEAAFRSSVAGHFHGLGQTNRYRRSVRIDGGGAKARRASGRLEELVRASNCSAERAIELYERATEMHEGQIADWKRLYDQANEALQAARDQTIETLEKNRLIAALEERVALRGTADASPARPAAEEKPLSTKERETLLKIVIGMARDSYKYDPKLNRSSVPQEIADDLAKHSIFLDVDTVRKWLKQAAEFLPGD